jgi:two-component system cell cycle sensor histidine kinase/response regulator CckA
MPNGGRLLVATENLKTPSRTGAFEEIREGEYSALRVTDTGVGIAPEERDKIFEPFYSKKKLGRSGTGLGMAVVWGSVKDHNGYVDMDSGEGEGTKFTLYFPATQEQVAPAQAVYSDIKLRGRGESILVIDDVKEQREIATKILVGLGYSVLTFSSGEEAIEYLKRASADLLVLDMLMEPGIDGLETYKRIVELHPRQKAILTTGFAETVRIKEALRMGVGTCLKKPYLINEIGHAIRAELEKGAQAQRKSRGVWN